MFQPLTRRTDDDDLWDSSHCSHSPFKSARHGSITNSAFIITTTSSCNINLSSYVTACVARRNIPGLLEFVRKHFLFQYLTSCAIKVEKETLSKLVCSRKKKLESLLNPFNQPHRRCQRIQLTYYFARRRPVYYNNTNGKCRVAQSPPNSLWFFIF
jgi:hypothetical protein